MKVHKTDNLLKFVLLVIEYNMARSTVRLLHIIDYKLIDCGHFCSITLQK